MLVVKSNVFFRMRIGRLKIPEKGAHRDITLIVRISQQVVVYAANHMFSLPVGLASPINYEPCQTDVLALWSRQVGDETQVVPSGADLKAKYHKDGCS
jgi:hypothetical protein